MTIPDALSESLARVRAGRPPLAVGGRWLDGGSFLLVLADPGRRVQVSGAVSESELADPRHLDARVREIAGPLDAVLDAVGLAGDGEPG